MAPCNRWWLAAVIPVVQEFEGQGNYTATVSGSYIVCDAPLTEACLQAADQKRCESCVIPMTHVSYESCEREAPARLPACLPAA